MTLIILAPRLVNMQQIEDEDVIRRVKLENPWWGPDRSTSQMYKKWKPRAYLDLFLPLVMQTDVRRAIVLMGPRRVGKTVMLHHAIQALLDSGVNPEAICYFSVDNPIYNMLSIEKFMSFYTKATQVDFTKTQVYAIFDEIQYLKNWEVHLKTFVDTYPLVKPVVSGSAAAALRLKSEESGAGRFTDFLLPPLTFYEFLDLKEETDLLTTIDDPDQQREGVVHNMFRATDIEQLNEKFIYYLNYGGYPEVIFTPHIQEDPARFIKSDIIDKVLLRDLPSLYGIQDIQELNYLFTTLAFNTANEISLQELSQGSGVAKNTIKRYIDYLEAAFLIKVVHRIDHNAKRFSRATHFKVYLTNPSMRAALFSPLQPDDTKTPYLAETAIFSQWFHSTNPLYYARWNDGEVDIVMLGTRDQKPLWVVEVKWSDRYCSNPGELESLISFCQQNHIDYPLVTSKTEESRCNVKGLVMRFVPASVYCYTVGYNLIHGKKMLREVPVVKKEVAIENPSEGS